MERTNLAMDKFADFLTPHSTRLLNLIQEEAADDVVILNHRVIGDQH